MKEKKKKKAADRVSSLKSKGSQKPTHLKWNYQRRQTNIRPKTELAPFFALQWLPCTPKTAPILLRNKRFHTMRNLDFHSSDSYRFKLCFRRHLLNPTSVHIYDLLVRTKHRKLPASEMMLLKIKQKIEIRTKMFRQWLQWSVFYIHRDPMIFCNWS